jgi:hypothetical protein
MHKIIITYLYLLIVFGNSLAWASGDSLEIEVLLSPNIIQKMQENELDVNFINSFDFTPTDFIQLGTSKQLYSLGIGGIIPSSKIFDTKIKAFEFTSDNMLMLIEKKNISTIDSSGNLYRLFSLPNENMNISKGDFKMYLFDSKSNVDNSNGYSTYVILPGGKYAELFKISTPINSITECDNGIYVCTQNSILQFDYNSKKLFPLITIPNNQEIISIVRDTASNAVFFSTNSELYFIDKEKFMKISDQIGGNLKLNWDNLYVFNDEKKYLIRIVNISEYIKKRKDSINALRYNILTNEIIIDLVKKGKSDVEILNLIKTTSVNFKLEINDMIYLSEQGVSSAVIMEMKNAMKQKTK